MFGYSREAVRVKVKKCEGKLQTELRKFSVDPQITSLEVLQSILVKAFDIKSEFTLWYRTLDDCGQEVYLPLLSEWDLDAAFLKAHNISVSQRSEPCVQLKVDMKPFSEAVEDWEPCTSPAMQTFTHSYTDQQSVTIAQPPDKTESSFGFQGLFMNQVEKTFNMVSRAFNLYEDPNASLKPPLCDAEFRIYLDTVGKIINGAKLKEAIYCGGIDPSLRKVVWKHILNVYPEGMNGKQRMDYIKRKANEYYTLKTKWKECIQKGKVNADLAYVTSMVRKDVLRTDRHHDFYAGSDDNQNIASLFNILTTYALNHPSVSYCQGMSDLASPLLVTMGDEAHAYICLCALMRRLKPNFLLDGEAMTLKFAHLTESLQVYDLEFYNYLKSQQADDLLFCYRWLLLEMKREFAFDDALRMLEVLWASLPYKVHSGELCLIEKEFDPNVSLEDEPTPISPLVKTPRENAYTKVCAMRRQSSSFSLVNAKNTNISSYKQMNHSLDESESRKSVNNSSLKYAKGFQSLDDTALQNRSLDDKNTKDVQEKNCVRNTMKTLHEQYDTSSGKNNQTLTNGNTEGKDAPLGNQIRLLRDKISVHNNKFFSSSLDKLDGSLESENARPKVKMIKNLNEFLNFAKGANSNTLKQDKLQRTHSTLDHTSTRNISKIHSVLNKSFDDSGYSKKERPLLPKITNNVDKNENSSPDDSQDYYPMTTSMTRELRLELEQLDRQVFGPTYVINQCKVASESPNNRVSADGKFTDKLKHTNNDKINIPTKNIENNLKKICIDENTRHIDDIYVWENPLLGNPPVDKVVEKSGTRTPDEQAELDLDADTGEINEDNSGKKSITPIRLIKSEPSTESQNTTGENKHSIVHSSDSESSENEQTQVTKSPNEAKQNKFFSSMSQELENAKRNCETILNTKQANLNSVSSTINSFQKKYEVFKPTVQRCGASGEPVKSISGLPPPSMFGGGNPFLMYLCLTVLLQHRDYIMRNHMDYNELAMHFDKMVRKHNVNRVLNQARQMYAIYLKHQTQIKLRKSSDITT